MIYTRGPTVIYTRSTVIYTPFEYDLRSFSTNYGGYNIHFSFESAGDRDLQPVFRKLNPAADLQKLQKWGVKKPKITPEYDFCSFRTNHAPPSFGMARAS